MIKKTKKEVLTYEWKIAKTAKTREAKHSWQLVCCATVVWDLDILTLIDSGDPSKMIKSTPCGPALPGSSPRPREYRRGVKRTFRVSGLGFRGNLKFRVELPLV